MPRTFRNAEKNTLFFSKSVSHVSCLKHLVLIFVYFLMNFLALESNAQTTQLSFSRIPFTDPDIISPYRGAEVWNDEDVNNRINNPTESQYITPMDTYSRHIWGYLETAQGVYDFAEFDTRIKACIDKKQKYSFGIITQFPGWGPVETGGGYAAYPLYLHNMMQAETANSRDWLSGNTWVPNYNSPNYQARYLALLNALASYLQNTTYKGVRYLDVIGYVDIRGYGSWGEWHMGGVIGSQSDYPAGRQPTSTSLNSIIDAHITAFPNKQLMAIIASFDAEYLPNTFVPKATTYHMLSSSNNYGKIGWRRDSWGWTDPYLSAWLENNDRSYNGMRFDTAIMNRYKYAPIQGEGPCGGTWQGGQQAFWDMPRQAAFYHMTSMGNGNYCGEQNDGLTTRDSLRKAFKTMGYRIELTGGSMSSVVNTGSAMSITLNWRNVGVAPVYENWDVTFELQNQSTNAVVWSGMSSHKLRLWQPQATSTNVFDNFTLPSNIPNGTYRLVLKIKDQKNYRDPLPLAIQGRRSDGSYQIRQDLIFSGGGSNAAPVANAGNDQSITLPVNTTTLNGSATDADGTIASYAWTKVSGPAGGTISSANTASTGITGLTAGVYVFRLTVTDNSGATATNDIQVTVNSAPLPSNQAPTANAGPDQVITLPVNTTTLNGSATDADGTIASYAWTKVSGPAGGTISSANTASTGITGLTAGVYVFRLTVTDNSSATATNDIQVTVNSAPAPNQAPTANAGPDQVITLPVNTTTLNGSGTDPDGTIASFAWSKVSGPAGGTISSANTASTGITGLTAGVYVFRLSVTDNGGANATNDIQVTVNSAPAPNAAPTANAGPDRNITLPVNTTTVNGSGTDTDGTIASFAWTKVSGPAGGNLQSPAAASTNITGLNAGTYVFRLTVTDNDGATATDNVSVIVSASLAPSPSNQAPVANAGNNIIITLPVNTASLTGSGTDADGSIATYSWTKLSGPTGGNIQSANTASTNITSLIAGTYVYRLTVTDNAGAQSSDDVQVTVNPAPAPVGNQAPIANAGTNRSITLPTNSVSFTGSGTDPDGTIATYSWSKVSGPAGGTIQTPNAATTNITGLTAGTYVFRLTVTDNIGASASDDIQLTVNAAPVLPNQVPIANAGRDISITLPVNSTILNGSASTDPDGSIASYTWRKVQGPNGSSMTSNNSVASTVSDLARGVHEYELTVTDNRGGTATDRVLVTVIKINQKPLARLSRDTINVALPVQNTELSAVDSYDPDGTITNYQWTYQSGPKEPKVLAPSSAKTVVTDLVAGSYNFDLVVTDNDGDKASKAVVVIVSNSSSRRQIPDVSIYPNPATGLINVKINTPVEGRTTLTFVDMNGRPVMTDSFVKGFSSFIRQVNISSLPKGTYAIIIQVDQTEKVVEKVIKF